MTPDLFPPERKPFRLVRASTSAYEAEIVETQSVLANEEQAYRIGFGFAMAQARDILNSPPQTHEELDGYRKAMDPLPQSPEEFRRSFDKLNQVFQTFSRPLILILRP